MPAFNKSFVFIFPLTNIIALGGVAINTRANRIWFIGQDLPIGSMKDNETAMHEGKISRAG